LPFDWPDEKRVLLAAAKIHHHRGMLAMSGMCMHCACHPGSGTFVHLGWPLMRMLMGVSVIHGVLVFRRR
jgi:hypothetical protein